MNHHATQTESDTELVPKKTRNGFITIGAVAASVMSCVAVFQFFVPSKAEVAQLQKDVLATQGIQQADEKAISSDHDTLIKIEVELKNISDWVDSQRAGDFRTPRNKGNGP